MKGKKIFFIVFIITVLCIAYPLYKEQNDSGEKSVLARSEIQAEWAKSFPDPSKTSYQMGLYLDVNHNILYGSTLLVTENTCQKPLEELWFTTYPNAFRDALTSPIPKSAYYEGFDEGWLEFSEIRVNGYEASYELEGISTRVDLKDKVAPQQAIEVEMKWIAKIPKAAYRFGSKNNAFILGNFYPVLNVKADEWCKSYNSKFGDPFCYHCADYLVRLNTPEAYEVVATGVNLHKYAEDNGRQTHIIEANNVRDFSWALLYDYGKLNAKVGQTNIKLYAPKNDMQKAQPLLTDTAEILAYYAKKFGSYPYEEFKLVFVPMQGFQGMEHSGLIFLRDDFSGPDYNKRQNKLLLAHEIAHQWWYGIVGNDQINEPWLDEGLANWSAYKYLQEIKGQNVKRKLTAVPNLARGLGEFASTAEYYKVIYSGGEAFWFSLENELGSDGVFKILRRYLAEYQYDLARTQDLLGIIRDEADQDIDEFLHKWF